MMVDMIYWDQVSWKDPLIISSSQERLHYTGNCFYFIWPHLFLTELITDLTSNVWELRAEIRRWLQLSECEECVGGWLSRSAHHVWCGLWRGQPIMGRRECHSRWPESSLSVWRGTHSINDDWHSWAQESVRDERVEEMENTTNTRHKTLITQL